MIKRLLPLTVFFLFSYTPIIVEVANPMIFTHDGWRNGENFETRAIGESCERWQSPQGFITKVYRYAYEGNNSYNGAKVEKEKLAHNIFGDDLYPGELFAPLNPNPNEPDGDPINKYFLSLGNFMKENSNVSGNSRPYFMPIKIQDLEPQHGRYIKIHYAIIAKDLDKASNPLEITVALYNPENTSELNALKAHCYNRDFEKDSDVLVAKRSFDFSNSQNLMKQGIKFSEEDNGNYLYVPWTTDTYDLYSEGNTGDFFIEIGVDTKNEYLRTSERFKEISDTYQVLLFWELTGDGYNFGQELSACSGKINTLRINNAITQGSVSSSSDISISNVQPGAPTAIAFNYDDSKNYENSYIQINGTRYPVSLDEDCSPAVDCNADYSCSQVALTPGQRYHVSYWAKNQRHEQGNGIANLKFTFKSCNSGSQGQSTFEEIDFGSNLGIIGDWQKVEGEFVVPQTTDLAFFDLENFGYASAFFDDIRITPVNANIESFIYDPETRRLIAKLDQNNYATIYEYDAEGNLVRLKKETIDGIKTISEGRKESSKL